MAESEHVIELRNVRKTFGDFVAVEEADFMIREGEFFAMLGPSGCGKTTTLKMIAGFEQPSAGQVILNGEDVSRVQEALVGAKRAWLDPPQSEMQQRVALAIDVAVEVLVDFRTSPVPSNVWETVENHMARVHELLALGVPEVVGLGETIELLRSIETMATR